MSSAVDQRCDEDKSLFPGEETLLDVNGNPVNIHDSVAFQDHVMPYEKTGVVVDTVPGDSLVKIRDGREIHTINAATSYLRVTKCATTSLLYYTLNSVRKHHEELEALKEQKGDSNDQEKEKD